MPMIVPIKELKDTGRISQMVKESREPIFITKNGYGDMVLMSMESYEQSIRKLELLRKLDEAEDDYAKGAVHDGFASLNSIREKYGL
jgi:prevent-host-death family protein